MSARYARTRARTHPGRHGFSLVEVLLATFILAIGIIAVAALFPAGIAQQRRSVDDIIGPIVANNALAILRTRLRQEDFGTFEEFGLDPPLVTVDGDWPWLRPGFYFARKTISLVDPNTGTSYSETVFAGSISVFTNSNSMLDADEGFPVISGIPWNSGLYGLGANDAPVIIFNQAERSFPMQTQKQLQLRPTQYVWDCMFRRYQGRILVAIFVYRVTVPGGSGVVYTVPPNPSNPTVPPLPIHLQVDDPANTNFVDNQWDATDLPGTVLDERIIRGTDVNAVPYDAADDRQAWQEPRQWILDQNNNVHRVLSRTLNNSNVIEIELVRPLSEMPALATYFYPFGVDDLFPLPPDNNGLWDTDLVSNIWYLPVEIEPAPGVVYLLTPVYVTVRDL